MTVNYIACICW